MYLAGVSTRRIEDVSEILWGAGVSAGTVSNLNDKAFKAVDERRCRPLTREYPYVYVDGICLKRSWGDSCENVAVMVAIGVNEDGYRKAIGCAEGFTESAGCWRDFPSWPKSRGLRGVRRLVRKLGVDLLALLNGKLAFRDKRAHQIRRLLARDGHSPHASQEDVLETIADRCHIRFPFRYARTFGKPLRAYNATRPAASATSNAKLKPKRYLTRLGGRTKGRRDAGPLRKQELHGLPPCLVGCSRCPYGYNAQLLGGLPHVLIVPTCRARTCG